MSCQVPGLPASDCEDFGGEKPEKWHYSAMMWRDHFSKMGDSAGWPFRLILEEISFGWALHQETIGKQKVKVEL